MAPGQFRPHLTLLRAWLVRCCGVACRLGIVHPEISEVQAAAVFEAAAHCISQGVAAQPLIMVPLVAAPEELQNQAALVRRVAEQVAARTGECTGGGGGTGLGGARRVRACMPRPRALRAVRKAAVRLPRGMGLSRSGASLAPPARLQGLVQGRRDAGGAARRAAGRCGRVPCAAQQLVFLLDAVCWGTVLKPVHWTRALRCPRVAAAGSLAEKSDFLSFGTNDLVRAHVAPVCCGAGVWPVRCGGFCCTRPRVAPSPSHPRADAVRVGRVKG